MTIGASPTMSRNTPPASPGIRRRGHGGFKFDHQHNAEIPNYMRRAGGWYQGDCDWAIVATVFANGFVGHGVPKVDHQARDPLSSWHCVVHRHAAPASNLVCQADVTPTLIYGPQSASGSELLCSRGCGARWRPWRRTA
jgi:hypothetical protein